MDVLWIVIGGILIVVIFLGLREFWCWYLKVNEMRDLLREIRDELKVLNGVRSKGSSDPIASQVKKDKEENLRKLTAHLNSQEKVTNDDVEKLLGVSDATATRYLEELENWGIIRQVGETGRGVYYKKIK